MLLHNLFDGTSGVIKWHGLKVRMLEQELAALSEGNGVGEDALKVVNTCAVDADQVVANAEVVLGEDADGVLEEQVVMLKDGASEGVFNGDDGCINGGVDDEGIEDIIGDRAGDDLEVGCGGMHG